MYAYIIASVSLLHFTTSFRVNTGVVCPTNILRMTNIEQEDTKTPVKAKCLPVVDVNAPKQFDCTLAADVVFDPLGFFSSKKTLYWMRDAELKHARLDMFAEVVWPLSKLWHNDITAILNMDSILASGGKPPSILNGGISSVYATGILMFSIVVDGLLESKSGSIFWNAEKPKDYVPGDFGFDQLNLYDIEGYRKAIETAEINMGNWQCLPLLHMLLNNLSHDFQ